MGCWNGTCALSQLPIKHGEKAVLFILVETKSKLSRGENFCYVNDLYTPAMIPLFGEYNDYGSLENIETENADVVFNCFLNEITKGSCIVKEERIKSDKWVPDNIEELLNVIQKGRVFTKTNRLSRDEESVVSYLLMHRDIYDAVLFDIGNRKPYNAAYTFREYWENQFAKLAEKLDELKDKQEETKFSFALSLEELPLLGECKHFGLRYNYFMNLFCDNFNNSNPVFQNGVIDLIITHTALDLSRKMWMPQCGEGSQSEERKIHELIAKCVFKKVEEYKNGIIEDSNEEYTPEELEDMIKETIFTRDE